MNRADKKILLPCFLFHFYLTSFSQKEKNEEYYLIAQNAIEHLDLSEKNLLDSCLHIFYEEKKDTSKIAAIQVFIEFSENNKVWPLYNQWLQDYIILCISKGNKTAEVLQIPFEM